MKIGDHTILTPWDDPLGFLLDWRIRVARAIASVRAGGIPFTWSRSDDPDVHEMIAHLVHRERYPLLRGVPQKPLDRVLLWENSITGSLVQAFLLTEATYDGIGKHLGLSPAEVALYGRLFYDVRDGQGNRRPSILMRIKIELRGAERDEGNRLKLVALAGGATMLCQMIGQSTAEPGNTPLYDLVDQELTRRLVAGELRDGDLIRLQGNGLLRNRLDWEFKPPAQDKGGWDVVQRLLEELQPKVHAPTQEPEQQANTTQDLRSHFDAQRKVAGTPVPVNTDITEGGVDDLIKKSFGDKNAAPAI